MLDGGAPDEVAGRLALARRLTDEVGRLALAWYQSPRLRSERKPDGSVVTPVDRDGEALVRRAIEAEFPGDGALGEELGAEAGQTGWRWVIDPIDGTLSFLRGIPTFCVLIGIERGDEVIAGAAGFPALGEQVFAARGEGASWRTRSGALRPARVSAASGLAESTIEVGAPSAFRRDGTVAVRDSLAREVSRMRGWSDGFAFALVATGRVDGAIQLGLSRWDISPFIVIIEEAGGLVTSWEGRRNPVAGRILTAPPCMHEAISTVISNASGAAQE